MSEPLQPTKENIELAAKEGRLLDLSQMTGLPLDVLRGERILTRKERREWYHKNRKRLQLPRWGILETLDKK